MKTVKTHHLTAKHRVNARAGSAVCPNGWLGRISVSASAVVLALTFSSAASAQDDQRGFGNTALVNTAQQDTPLSANPAGRLSTDETLPRNLSPESLSADRLRAIDPDKAKKIRDANKSALKRGWDPAVLTQSTGISGATARTSGRPVGSASDSDAVKSLYGPRGGDFMSAEDLLNVGAISFPDTDSVMAVAPPLDDGVINLSSALRGALFDLPTDNVNTSVFKLDLGERLCLGTADECGANERNNIDLGYAKNITHGKRGGINLQLTPRAGLRLSDDSKSAVVGALLRVGENLRDNTDGNAWYLFAGADAETVSYNPNGLRSLSAGQFQLQDQLFVGDAQAGVGYRIGDADLALTYFKRQASADNYNYNEDAAALSVTWKR